MRLFGRKESRSEETGSARVLSDEELDQVWGGNQKCVIRLSGTLNPYFHVQGGADGNPVVSTNMTTIESVSQSGELVDVVVS